MQKKQYWRSFGELKNTDVFQKESLKKEFNDDAIEKEKRQAKIENSSPSRRDFLKYLGFTTAVTAIATSCMDTAVKKSIPFLNKPENIVPGEASHYATTFSLDGEVIPVLAKVRDGRPIKLNGNLLSNLYGGGTSSQVQAAVLSLYDVHRLRSTLQKNVAGKFEKVSDVNGLDKNIISKLENAKGKIALVTPTVSSPSSLEIISQFVSLYGATHVVYDTISNSAILEANVKTYNIKAIPNYKFDKAELIVSIGADFLGTWVSPTEFSTQWAKNRKPNMKDMKMSKHYQIESLMTITGASADERILIKPSEESLVVAYLYQVLTGDNSSPINLSAELKSALNKVALELQKNKNKALFVSGSNDVNTQILTNAINENIGSLGNTIDWSAPSKTKLGIDSEFTHFVSDLKQGKYEAVIFAEGVNPVYSFYNAKELASALGKVKTTISLNSQLDETTQLCHFVVPDSHFLESWDDHQIKVGHYSFSQPTIGKLFETRDWQESILVWSKSGNTSYEKYIRTRWNGKVASFDKVLQAGVYDAPENVSVRFSSATVASAFAGISTYKVSNGIELSLYQKVSIGSGSMANNPWLQELPDPITRATWDNYAIISTAMAEKLDIAFDDDYEVEVDKPVVKIQTQTSSIELPILIIPGTHKEVIGIALGYGRTDLIGKAVLGVGKNVYHLTTHTAGNVSYSLPVSSINKTGETYPIAYTQSHNSYEGRNEVMKEFTVDEFSADKNIIVKEREAEFQKYKNNVIDYSTYEKDATLYGKHDTQGIQWGMSIDLNACNGCGACIVSCNAENNIAVVGKKQVLKSHEMHWLRIDRYFSGNLENPEVVFQPMMCQHCNNAPCENVCPVNATNHSSEGLNQMAYNRCVGTRYCANNCPFKVRRFNWLDFTGADSFPDNQKPLVEEGSLDEVVLDMNEDLTRMVLNPDVTVRSRGVIEKCSFCVQALQSAKINAKKEGVHVQDRHIQTACQSACATDAIVFGNVKDKESKIAKIRNEDQKERVFYVLEQIHVLPNVNYLAKIRNKQTEHKTEKTMHHS